MCHAGSRIFAAALRGVGLDARACPEGRADAWERALRFTTGDECYPQRVVLADLLQALEESGLPPRSIALFLTTGDGPCRFGQYAPYLERTLRRMGLGDVVVLAPNSDSGYREVGRSSASLRRVLWWAVVASDALRRLLHRTRPYEVNPGDADRVCEACLGDLESSLEGRGLSNAARLDGLAAALGRSRERFRAVPVADDGTRPVVGVVGEIFCRLNTYSNDDVIRKIEAFGGEAWLSGVVEWVWYSNALEMADLKRTGRGLSRRRLSASVSEVFQRRDEERLLAPLDGALRGREDPHDVRDLLAFAEPYLPWRGAIGEMVLSVGKAVWLWRSEADGVIDVSPFGCMNGIVSEAVYPRVSRDCEGIPIRSFYVDRATSRVEDGLEIFLELVRSYRRKRLAARGIPPASACAA